MHSKGVIHADIKPLNVVRLVNEFLLIDLDAACKIGIDPVVKIVIFILII